MISIHNLHTPAIPCGFAYYIVSTDKAFYKPPIVYRGNDVVETFLNLLLQEETNIMCLLRKIEPMHLNLAIEEEFKRATHCSICGLVFKDKFEKVRNHDHITGDFLGIAHRNCNLQYFYPLFCIISEDSTHI